MMKLSSSPVVRVSVATTLFLLLSVAFYFFTPSPVPFGPITLEEEFARMAHEVFATERAFEQLQELLAPSGLVMRYPDYDSDPQGPIYIDVTHDKSSTLHGDDVPSHIDASVIRDTSGIHDNIPLFNTVPTVPLPGAAPCPSHVPSSAAPLLLGCSVIILCAVAAGTLFINRALAPKTRGPARISRRVSPATKPRFRSSGETRRFWAVPRRNKKFRPSLPSISESPLAAFTFDAAGFLKALESLARDQREAKRRKQEQNPPLCDITASNKAPAIRSNHVRALTDENAPPTKVHEPSKPANSVQSRSRTRTAPGQLRLVPGTPTRAGAAVRRIVPVSPLRLPTVVRTVPSKASTNPPLAPVAAALARAPLVSERSQPPASLVPGAILYQTSAPAPRRGAAVIYETPAPITTSVIYSTSGSTTVAPTHPAADPSRRSVQRTSGIVFHGRSGPQPLAALSAHNTFQWTQLQSQAATTHRARACLGGRALGAR